MSLQRLISLISSEGDDMRILMVGDRVRLARLLITGLLRYYSTEWGRACCEGDQIQLFDFSEDEPKKPMQLTSPHLAARIRRHKGNDWTQRCLQPIDGVVNTAFFSLSLLLLQIAHTKDWVTLQEESFLPSGTAEYELALNLAKHSSGMPPRYHRAVEKLLQYEIPDLDDIGEHLQGKIHEEIIMPLEELELIMLEDKPL